MTGFHMRGMCKFPRIGEYYTVLADVYMNTGMLIRTKGANTPARVLLIILIVPYWYQL